MSPALIIAAAIALILLLLAGVRLWILRSRRTMDAPVTELEAGAHALPLTKSSLPIGPRTRGRGDFDG